MVKVMSTRISWIGKFALGASLLSGQHQSHQHPVPEHNKNVPISYSNATIARDNTNHSPPATSSSSSSWMTSVQPPINFVKNTLMPILEKMQEWVGWTTTAKRIKFKQIIAKRIRSRVAEWKIYEAPATLERMSLTDILIQRPLPKESAFFATGDCEGVAVVPAKICLFTQHKDLQEENLKVAIENYKRYSYCDNTMKKLPEDRNKWTHDMINCAGLKQKVEYFRSLNHDNADEEEYKRMLILVWIASQSPSGELNTFTPHEDQWLMVRASRLGRSQAGVHEFKGNQYFPGAIEVAFEERKSGVLIHELCHAMLSGMIANKPEMYKIIYELYKKYRPKLLNLGKTGKVYGGYNRQVLKMENPHFTDGLKYLEENQGNPYIPYMTDNVHEFFAVAVETWFDAPYFTLKNAASGYGRSFLNKEALLKFIPELKEILGSMFLPWTYSETELNVEIKKINLKEYRPSVKSFPESDSRLPLYKYGLGHESENLGRHLEMSPYRIPPGNLEEKFKKVEIISRQSHFYPSH